MWNPKCRSLLLASVNHWIVECHVIIGTSQLWGKLKCWQKLEVKCPVFGKFQQGQPEENRETQPQERERERERERKRKRERERERECQKIREGKPRCGERERSGSHNGPILTCSQGLQKHIKTLASCGGFEADPHGCILRGMMLDAPDAQCAEEVQWLCSRSLSFEMSFRVPAKRPCKDR